MTAPAPPASSYCSDGPAPSKATTTSGQPSPPAETWGGVLSEQLAARGNGRGGNQVGREPAA
eukprot:11202361-Alexandrium_andersonii.AAC.1